MISSSYLIAIHAIRTRNCLPAVSGFSLAGDFDSALACAMAAAGKSGDPLSQADLWQDIADLHLLKGESEAAESSYEKSVALLQGHALLGAMSCRATGMQMLAQGRLETATRCFFKNLRSTHVALRLEALAACALLYREAGLQESAQDYLRQLKEEAVQGELGDWKYLADTLAQDFRVHGRILSSPCIGDHVFWQQDWQTARAPGPCEGVRQNFVAGLQTVLDDRRRHLSRLLVLSNPSCASAEFSVDEPVAVRTPAQRSHRTWNERLLRQEMVLAALSGGHWVGASKLLQGIGSARSCERGACAVTGVFKPAKLELMYCHAKVRMEQGAMAEGRLLYARYLHSAMDAVRGFTSALSQLRERDAVHMRAAMAQSQVPTAPPGRALAPRYARAYDYLQANYQRADLSVHEVAASIGVSNRALQLQFKRSLGVTPRELIRTLRLTASGASASGKVER